MPKIELSQERIDVLKAKIEETKKVYKQAYDRFDVNDLRLIQPVFINTRLLVTPYSVVLKLIRAAIA